MIRLRVGRSYIPVDWNYPLKQHINFLSQEWQQNWLNNILYHMSLFNVPSMIAKGKQDL